jgi:uncharacterized protein YciI
MIFAVTFAYGPEKAKVVENRPAHREYQRELISKGKLVIAGPFMDDSGSIIAYEAASEEEVEGIIKADPFFKCGIFQTWTIRPWRIVTANRELLP